MVALRSRGKRQAIGDVRFDQDLRPERTSRGRQACDLYDRRPGVQNQLCSHDDRRMHNTGFSPRWLAEVEIGYVS